MFLSLKSFVKKYESFQEQYITLKISFRVILNLVKILIRNEEAYRMVVSL